MSVTNVVKDVEQLTMTVTAEYDVSAERAWELWGDPRQLERWWGPPSYPATFTDHDLTVGSRVSYYMTSPEGDKPHGFWDVLEVDAPRHLLVRDGFADDDGRPLDSMPTGYMDLDIADREGRRRRGHHPVQVRLARGDGAAAAGMGMEEGMREAMGQIDGLLAA